MGEHFEVLCSIALCHSDRIWITTKDRLYVTLGYGTNDIECPLGFIYNEKLGKIDTLEDDKGSTIKKLEDGCMYIENLKDKIIELYHQKTQLNIDVINTTPFKAISKYFANHLKEICRTQSTSFEGLYLVITIPNDWETKVDITSLILTPLFEKAGIPSAQNCFDRILYLTELNASLSYLQLGSNYNDQSHTFIQNENRCILFNMNLPSTTKQPQAIFFQFKEDEDLKILSGGKRVYVPKITNVDENLLFGYIDVEKAKHLLQHFIFEETLGLDCCSSVLFHESDDSFYENTADRITNTLLQSVRRYIEEGVASNCSGYLDMRLGESQLLLTDNFHEELIKILETFLSSQIQMFADYIDSQNAKVPFFRKSIIVNGGTSEFGPWLELGIHTVFIHLLIKEVEHRRHQSKGVFDIHSFLDLPSPAGPLLFATAKSMKSNIMLPPVVIEEKEKRNKIGCFIHTEARQTANYTTAPNCIAFINVSMHSVSVFVEIVDEEGYIQKKITLNSQQTEEKLLTLEEFLQFECSCHGVFDENDFDFDNFKEAKITKMLLKNVSRKPSMGSRFKFILNTATSTKRKIDTTLKTKNIRSYFARYVNQQVGLINAQLKDKNAPVQKVGYVLCVDKLIMNNLLLQSRIDFSKFIKKTVIAGSGNIIVVDQGEEAVWNMLQIDQLNPPSFYVHSHIQDNHIYLKLHQVVDTSGSNSGVPHQSTIFIKDKIIPIIDTYEQFVHNLWSHIQLLDDTERCEFFKCDDGNSNEFFKKYDDFNKIVTNFIKYTNLPNNADTTHKHVIQVSDGITLAISLEQIIRIAVIPVLTQLCSIIIASLTNTDIFGLYEIAKLYITGACLKISNFNESYHNSVIAEMRKLCHQLLRENTHRTKLGIAVNTSRKSVSTSNSSTNGVSQQSRKSFVYDTFLRGELRIVSSSTYLAHFASDYLLGEPHTLYDDIDGEIKCGYSTSLLLRGKELRDRKIKIMENPRIQYDRTRSSKFFMSSFFRYHEPQIVGEAKDMQKMRTQKYLFLCGRHHEKMKSVNIQYLHHSSCVRIDFECNHHLHFNVCFSSKYAFSERFTLKYFK